MSWKPSHTRRLKRAVYFIPAVIFLFEAWLWEKLYPIVAALVDWLPWERLKTFVAKQVAHFPPLVCAALFIIPALLILPFKLIGLWLIGCHHLFLGVATFVLAKLVGLGAAAFLFETCREKLLSLRWFLWLYHAMLAIKAWAQREIEPAKRLLTLVKLRVLGKNGRLVRALKKLRKKLGKNH